MPLPHPPNPWRPRAPRRRRNPAGSINVNLPGYTPNYDDLIANDPTFLQRKNYLAGLSANDKATRNKLLRDRLVAFGALPDLTGVDLGDFGLDPDTIAAIQANTNPNTSVSAGLERAHQQRLETLRNTLAARGALRSGSLGVGTSLEQEQATGDRTKAITDLLAALSGYQGDFASAEQGRYDELYGPGGLAEKTKDDLIDSGLYEPREGSSVRATRDPATGLYRDAEGNYYDANGNPVRNPTRRPGFGAYQGAQRFRRRRNFVPAPPRPYQPGYRP